jgi:hypothetical protein
LELAADRARRAGVELTADQLVVAAVFDSGEHAQDPAALARAFAVGRVDPVVLSVVLPWVWRYKLDACTLPVGAWREMFAAVPYAVNGRATDRPRWARRLYRGAPEGNREGLSWTAHLDVAGYFAAHRQAPDAMGRVWTAVVAPARMLARLNDEHEYVVDARDLPMYPIDPAEHRHRRVARLPGLRPWTSAR